MTTKETLNVIKDVIKKFEDNPILKALVEYMLYALCRQISRESMRWTDQSDYYFSLPEAKVLEFYKVLKIELPKNRGKFEAGHSPVKEILSLLTAVGISMSDSYITKYGTILLMANDWNRRLSKIFPPGSNAKIMRQGIDDKDSDLKRLLIKYKKPYKVLIRHAVPLFIAQHAPKLRQQTRFGH
jgi:hypothetical protein